MITPKKIVESIRARSVAWREKQGYGQTEQHTAFGIRSNECDLIADGLEDLIARFERSEARTVRDDGEKGPTT